MSKLRGKLNRILILGAKTSHYINKSKMDDRWGEVITRKLLLKLI